MSMASSTKDITNTLASRENNGDPMAVLWDCRNFPFWPRYTRSQETSLNDPVSLQHTWHFVLIMNHFITSEYYSESQYKTPWRLPGSTLTSADLPHDVSDLTEHCVSSTRENSIDRLMSTVRHFWNQFWIRIFTDYFILSQFSFY